MMDWSHLVCISQEFYQFIILHQKRNFVKEDMEQLMRELSASDQRWDCIHVRLGSDLMQVTSEPLVDGKCSNTSFRASNCAPQHIT